MFANAGINGVLAPIDQLQPEEWDRTLDINLKGTYLTVHYAVLYLKRGGGGSIITSSVNGTRTLQIGIEVELPQGSPAVGSFLFLNLRLLNDQVDYRLKVIFVHSILSFHGMHIAFYSSGSER